MDQIDFAHLYLTANYSQKDENADSVKRINREIILKRKFPTFFPADQD